MRTDENNNPTAMIEQLALQGGLVRGVEFVKGTKFPGNSDLYTAKFLKDPIKLTIKVIDRVGFYTKAGVPRWEYISIPSFIWLKLSEEAKLDIIGFMYQREGGTKLQALFPRYGKLK